MRDGFIFYRSFAEALSKVDAETKAQVLDALCSFALDGEEVDLDGVAGALFSLMRPQVEANNKKYLNGCKGGRPRTETEPSENQSETKIKPSENQVRTDTEPKEKEKDKEKEKEKEKDIYSAETSAPVEAIPLNDGTEWRPPLELYEEYVRLFPGVDVPSAFRAMRAWSLSNVSQRKTKTGVSRFVRAWLQREQDRPRQVARDQQRRKVGGFEMSDIERLVVNR